MHMLTRDDFHGYQDRAVEHVVDSPRAMLWLDLSLGKTIITATALVEILNRLESHGALIVAPRRVAETVWRQETAKWTHTAGLDVCVLRGSNKRLLTRELVRPHDIWVINYEALPWLVPTLNKVFLSQGRHLPFDTIVFDEVTRTKNEEGKRVSLFWAKDKNGNRLIDHFTRRIGLTGTPAPNGYWDLFGQYYIIDDGLALGSSRRVFAEKYFTSDLETGRRFLVKGAKAQIEERISPITLSMRAEDYLELPDYIYNNLWVDLPAKTRAQYDSLEAQMFAEMDHGTVEVFNAASLTAKCRQVANGIFIDTETGQVHTLHEAKLEAFDEVMEEAAGQPVLGSYVFRGDMERLRKRYGKTHRVGYLGPGVGDLESDGIINDWNAGKFDLLLVHHGSAGHGLNLQFGGHQIVWMGLDWPLEGWLQLNGRLRRQGQKAAAVIVHRILARDTVDEAILDRLEGKARDQDDLRAAIDALQKYREKKN